LAGAAVPVDAFARRKPVPILVDMLARLRQHGYASAPVILPRRGVPLHAMVVSAGYARECSPSYAFDNRQRGRSDVALFQYTLSGRGMVHYDGADRVVNAGSALLLHWPQASRYWLPPGWEWEHFFVCLNGSELLRLWRAIEAQAAPILELGDEHPIVQRASEIAYAVLGGQLGDPFACSQRAYGLAMDLLGHLVGEPVDTRQPEGVQRAMRYARQHVADPIGVEDLARVAGCSRYHFSRLFRTATGQSPGSWLIGERLAVAARLLDQTDYGLQEIAERSGFNDGNYFGKAFRKAYGMAPGAYRRLH